MSDATIASLTLNSSMKVETHLPALSLLSVTRYGEKGWSDTTDETRVITLLVLTFKSLIPGNSTVPGKLRNVGHHTDGTSLCWWLIPVTPQSGFSFFSFSWKRQRLVNLEVHSSPFWKWSLFSSTTKHFLGKDWNRDNKNQIIVLWGSW